MSERIETVRRVMDATERQDWDAVLAELDPAVEIDDQDMNMVESGQYRGHAGYLKWLSDWGASWESWRIEDVRLRPARGGKVVALFRFTVRGRGSGIELTREDASVFELEQPDRITRVVFYNDQGKALEAAGLSESDV